MGIKFKGIFKLCCGLAYSAKLFIFLERDDAYIDGHSVYQCVCMRDQKKREMGCFVGITVILEICADPSISGMPLDVDGSSKLLTDKAVDGCSCCFKQSLKCYFFCK